MDFMGALLIIIIIIFVFFAFAIVKKLLKLALTALIAVVILIFIGYLMVNVDYNNIKQALPHNEDIVLLSYDGTIVTGFIDSTDIIPISQKELEHIDLLFQRNNLNAIRGVYDHLVVVDVSVIGEMKSVKINNKDVLGKQLFYFFTKGDPIAQIVPEDVFIDTHTPNMATPDFESLLFANTYHKGISLQTSPIYFVKTFKKHTIRIYPISPFMHYARMVPISVIEAKLNKLKQQISTITDEK